MKRVRGKGKRRCQDPGRDIAGQVRGERGGVVACGGGEGRGPGQAQGGGFGPMKNRFMKRQCPLRVGSLRAASGGAMWSTWLRVRTAQGGSGKAVPTAQPGAERQLPVPGLPANNTQPLHSSGPPLPQATSASPSDHGAASHLLL